MKMKLVKHGLTVLTGSAALMCAVAPAHAADKKPNVVMLMTDDTGWNDFGCYSGGGVALGHPTPNVDRMAAEGAMFTCWYGQASCTAGRASFMTGRIPMTFRASIFSLMPSLRTSFNLIIPITSPFLATAMGVSPTAEMPFTT